MKMFGKRANTLKEALNHYVEELRSCIKWFEDFFLAYSKGVCGASLAELEREVRHAEARCDDVRREMQAILFTGAFMPDFRSDIFDLLERTDRVPNKIEKTVVLVSISGAPLPEEFIADFHEIVCMTIECSWRLADSLDILLDDLHKAVDMAKKVEELETQIDRIERRLYRRIFQCDTLQSGQKMLLRSFVEGICSISDKAEDASDRIELMAIKRKA